MRAQGDFTADRRLIAISALAIGVGAICGLVAVVLLKLIGLFTNLFFYGRLSMAFVSPAHHHLGAAVILVPVVGGLIIGLMARYGSERIRGHGIPEAMEAILIGRSKMQPKVAILKPLSSAISIGSGGPFGKGLTNGTQNQLNFLPVQESDFVAAIYFEELGFVGAVLLLLLFGALIWRILVGGWRSKDPFGTMFAAGLASMLLFQLTVNLGMVVGIMPITGIPLPFVSHGGASLISLAVGLGILQSINIRQTRAEW